MAEYLIKMTVGLDGVPQVTGGLQQVEDAANKTTTSTGRIAGGMNEATTAAGRMAASNDQVIASLAGYAASIFSIYAIGSAIKSLVSNSLDYQGKIETAGLGIASSYLVGGKYIDNTTGKVLQGQQALNAAQADSAQVMEKLKVANMETIATLDQLVRAYQETLPVAMARGFNRDQVEKFTQAMVQAAGAIGLPFDQMGEETRSLLTGNINPRNSRIATVLGLRNEDIAQFKNDTQGLFDFLMQRLEGYKIAGIESQKTWAGLWSNWKDIQNQMTGMAFEPLFVAIKSELAEITKHMVTIDEKTKTIKWNPELLTFIDSFKEKITAVIAEIYRMGMLLDKAGGTKTTLDMLGSGVGSAMNISRKDHPFLAAIFGSKEEFEEAAAKNIQYAENFLTGDKKLQRLANLAAGLDENGNPVKKATANNTYSSTSKPADEDKYKDITDQIYNKYSNAFDQMSKQIRANNPDIDDLTRKLQEVDAGVLHNITGVKEYDASLVRQGEALKKSITAQEEHIAAIKAASSEMQYQMDLLTNRPTEGNQAGEMNLRWESELKELDALQPSAGIDKLNKQIAQFEKLLSDIPGKSDEVSRAIAKLKADFAASSGLDALLQGNQNMQTSLIKDPYERQKQQIQDRYDFERVEQLKALDAAEKDADKRAAIEKQLALLKQKYDKDTADNAADSYKAQLNEASGYTAMAAQAFTLLAGTQDESSRKGFEAAKDYNMGAAAMNTASAIMAQLTIPGPKGWISAGLAFAAGMVQLDTISNTTFGSSGSVTAPGAFDLSGGGGSAVGSSIGSRLTSNSDSQSQDSLQRLADASDNASRAIGRVADGFSAIADLFTEGGMASLASGAAPGSQVALTSSPNISFTKWMGATLNPAGHMKSSGFSNEGVRQGIAMADPISAYVTRSIFGGGWNTTAGGMSLGVQGGSAVAGNYITREKDGGWFGSDKTKTTFTNNPEWAATINEMLAPAISSINRAAITMGTSADISGVNMKATNIATAGRSPADIAKDMQAWLERVAAEMALTVDGLKNYAYQGENAYLALMRLNDALVTTNDTFELLGAKLVDSSLAGADFAFRLQDMFGGAEAFAESFDTYFTTMYTESEQKALQAAQAQRQVNAAFDEMKIAAPATRQEFTAIVDSYIAQGEAGAGMLVDLMGIAPAFGLVADAAETAADKLREVAMATEDLAVRNLTSMGQSIAAQRMQLQLDAARAVAEAEQNNMGADYIARLKNTMALEASAWELQSAISAEKQNIAAQQANQAAQLEAGKRKTQTIYDDQVKAAQSAYDAQVKSSQSAIDGLSSSVSNLKSFADSLKSTLEEMRPYTMSEAQAVVDQAIKSRNIGNTDQLSSAISAMQNIDTNNYSTALDYQRDQLMNATRVESLKNIANGQLSSAERSLKYAQEQLELLKVNHAAQLELMKTKFDEQIASINMVGADQTAALDRQYEAAIAQITALYGINNSVLSVANAMSRFMSAASAGTSLTTLPQFADGGITAGLSLAGEYGPEAIIPLPDGRRVPVQIQGNSDNYKEVVTELQGLRAELRAMASNTEKQTKTTTKWDKNGMPEVRTA